MEIHSRLLVGVSVTDAPNDKEQLAPTLAAVSPVIESVGAVLVDSGYYSAAAVAEAEQPRGDAAGPKIYAQRKQTIEPIFGIIKGTLGFRRFSLRGLKKVGTEWTLGPPRASRGVFRQAPATKLPKSLPPRPEICRLR